MQVNKTLKATTVQSENKIPYGHYGLNCFCSFLRHIFKSSMYRIGNAASSYSDYSESKIKTKTER